MNSASWAGEDAIWVLLLSMLPSKDTALGLLPLCIHERGERTETMFTLEVRVNTACPSQKTPPLSSLCQADFSRTKLVRVTLVGDIAQVAGVRFCNTPSVCCAACSPPRVASPPSPHAFDRHRPLHQRPPRVNSQTPSDSRLPAAGPPSRSA